MSPRPTSPCPCGGPSLDNCCGPFLAGAALPPTAEHLMRSRYTAFTLKDEAYLRATWHPSTLPQEPIIDNEPIRWLGLEIKTSLRLRKRKAKLPDVPEDQGGGQDHGPDRDTVEFVARFKVGGRAHRLHELSRFVREPGPDGAPRWFYLDGSFPDKQ
ncbi:YchJ family metal-binding protein [Massilia aurea]|uniref:YchJ family protein n=1 Tax=Massilia aurea TaxID=373040 RepID=UPI003462EA90